MNITTCRTRGHYNRIKYLIEIMCTELLQNNNIRNTLRYEKKILEVKLMKVTHYIQPNY